MEQINVLKILENAPTGLKLYSPVYGEVTFDCIFNNKNIRCVYNNNTYLYFDKYGKLYPNGEVMLFPSKDTSNWNCWPSLIQHGDIVITENPENNVITTCKAILTDDLRGFYDAGGNKRHHHRILRWANKEEIEQFRSNQMTFPFVNCKFRAVYPKQEDNLLKPFDKVLVRDEDDKPWTIDIFIKTKKDSKYKYQCFRNCWKYCIPYNDNTKHLLGTNKPYLG